MAAARSGVIAFPWGTFPTCRWCFMAQSADAAVLAMGRRKYRGLARRTGLRESYEAQWNFFGGCFDPRGMVRIRVKRYRVRATLKAEVFDDRAATPTPTEIKRWFLTVAEWRYVVEGIEAAGFWQLPIRHHASSAGFHGQSWTIEGFRAGRFHFVRRTYWSVLDGVGAEVFDLGKRLGQLADLSLFQEIEN